MLKNIKTQRRILGLLIATLVGFFLSLWGGGIQLLEGNKLFSQPAIAQSSRPETVAVQVYENLSYLPQENQYLRQENGEVDTDNTLVSRLVRYHLFIKSRPTNFRLDWKLTLADYLGVNEKIKEARYPGYKTLQENPLPGDRQAINSLTRQQRNELVQVLMAIFNPQRDTSVQPQPTPTPNPQVTPQPSPSPPNTISLPKEGDAQLLMP